MSNRPKGWSSLARSSSPDRAKRESPLCALCVSVVKHLRILPHGRGWVTLPAAVKDVELPETGTEPLKHDTRASPGCTAIQSVRRHPIRSAISSSDSFSIFSRSLWFQTSLCRQVFEQPWSNHRCTRDPWRQKPPSS